MLLMKALYHYAMWYDHARAVWLHMPTSHHHITTCDGVIDIYAYLYRQQVQ
jgi:hypothetical protein